MFAETFDIDRALLSDTAFKPPFPITDTQPLGDVVKAGKLKPDTAVLVAEVGETVYVFPTLHIVYHQIAQGKAGDTDWVIAFCPICNGGAVFSPVVDGTLMHFAVRGLYNAMLLMGDDETNSYWDHITGECVHGPHKGKSLGRIAPLLHMNVAQALAAYPNAQTALSKLTPDQQREAEDTEVFRTADDRENPDFIEATLGEEDTRLPRLDMGLGVWDGDVQRFYPVLRLNAENNAIIDEVNGRKLLVYIEPVSHTPAALYVNADSAQWRDDVLLLSDGCTVRDGVLCDVGGKRTQMARPMQVFQRWFGFSFTFPGCDIYGSETPIEAANVPFS